MMIQYNYFSSWANKFFTNLGGCFGCFVKPTPITAVDQPTKGLRIRGRAVRRQPVVSEGFWSTSAGELDCKTLHSQRSASSINTSTLTHTSDKLVSHSEPFVNQGLILWNQTRLQWLGKGREQTQESHEPALSWDATYQSLLATGKPFAQRVPLPEMVEFLVQTWEQEGMYD
uniref:Gag1-like clamp domain-containing protein n=1 Tax=Kalanchoe fedtschenkoi TaxID=63787 RepID=A0A7N0TDJ7_KALFE